MRIAVPVSQGRLAPHFGHARRFALLDVDTDKRRITASTEVDAPEHQPGRLPAFLKAHGVGVVIAGGMGPRAQSHFAAAAIEVVTGAPADGVDSLVARYLAGTLVSAPGTCDHSGHGHGRCHGSGA